MFSKSWQDWSPIIIVAPFFHLPSLLVSRSLVSQSNLSGSCFFSRCWIKNAIKFLYSFKKQLTFFYKVVENGDVAIAINFALLINIGYVDISYFVEIYSLGWIVISCAWLCFLHHLHSYLRMHLWSYYWKGCRGYLHCLHHKSFCIRNFHLKIMYFIKHSSINSFITPSIKYSTASYIQPIVWVICCDTLNVIM